MDSSDYNINDLADLITRLSTKEQNDLFSKINLLEIIKKLPLKQKTTLFNDLFWQKKECVEEKNQIYFYRSGERKTFPELERFPLIAHLIECVRYTNKDTNEMVLSFESWDQDGTTCPKYTLPMPTSVSEKLLTYLNFYIIEMFYSETHKILQTLGEKVFNLLKEGYPNDFKDFRIAVELSKKNTPLKKGYDEDPKDFQIVTHIRKKHFEAVEYTLLQHQQEETFARFAYYKNLHETELKNIKTHFKKIYNNLNHKIPSKKREAKAKSILFKERPDLQNKELTHRIGLNFKPAEESIILAAKECCLNPFSKSGKISSQIRKTLRIGQELLLKEYANYIFE